MGRLLRNLPPGPVCIVGSDIPGLHAHHVAAAFAALTRNDAVFGPATDGGYWLVGLKRVSPPPPAIFCGVRWSTPHALDDSIATLGRCKVARVAELADVDTVEDLPRHPCR